MLRQASSNAADQATYAKFTNLADADKKRFEREKAEYVVLTRCSTTFSFIAFRYLLLRHQDILRAYACLCVCLRVCWCQTLLTNKPTSKLLFLFAFCSLRMVAMKTAT